MRISLVPVIDGMEGAGYTPLHPGSAALRFTGDMQITVPNPVLRGPAIGAVYGHVQDPG